MSKPDYIPDMSLGERDDKPAPPPTDVASSYQPKEAPAPASTPAPKPAAPPEWREGDPVLAPWEPNFLYPGMIAEIKIDDAKGDQALIEYDDGGEGWVFVYSLCKVEVKEGQQVQVRRQNGAMYYPAKILEVADDEVQVHFDDGGTAWTPIAALRIPCIENGPGALGTKLAPWQPQQGANPQTGAAIPSWVWTIGLIILVMVLRVGCRAIGN